MKFLSTLSKSRLKGAVALVRIDLNVAHEKPSEIFRLDAVIPTLRFLVSAGAKVVIVSHKGRPVPTSQKEISRPNYQASKKNLEFSLKPFTRVIQKKTGQKTKFFPHFDFEKIRWEIASGKEKVYLLENIRFCSGEEKNEVEFAKTLASLADLYVNDAFAVSHRKNASVHAITTFLPSYAGLCFERECSFLGSVLKEKNRPFVVIIGGAKAKDKLGVVRAFWNKADAILLGGGPANTFFAAAGELIGNSTYDKDSIPMVRKIMNSEKIYLPLDDKIQDKKILDIGPETIDEYARIISHAKVVFWNGTMGYYHDKKFAGGTAGMWEALLKNKRALVVVGGGETTASIRLVKKDPIKLMRERKNIFLSTGGGAMLEFLSGKKLPGIQALQ